MRSVFTGRILAVGLAALALSACSSNADTTNTNTEPDNEFLAGVPEQAALELKITEDVDAEGLASANDAVGAEDDDTVGAALAAGALGDLRQALVAGTAPADGVARPVQAVRELNQALRDFLQPIAALARNTEPSVVDGNVALWGPVTRGVTEYRLFVKKGLLKRYGWLLQARADGSSDAFANVAAGGIQLGAVLRRGRGTVGVDLDALGEVDPTVAARGKVLASFAHGPRGTVLAYRLKEFTRDAEDTAPIDAAFQGVHLLGGYNRVRVAFYGNLPETATEAEELVLARVRHHRGEGGRADMLVLGGDVADGKAWLVSECWNRALASAYRVVRECPGDGIGGQACSERSSTGDPAACLGDIRLPDFPPANPEEPMADDESPEPDLVPPDVMPSGEADAI